VKSFYTFFLWWLHSNQFSLWCLHLRCRLCHCNSFQFYFFSCIVFIKSIKNFLFYSLNIIFVLSFIVNTFSYCTSCPIFVQLVYTSTSTHSQCASVQFMFTRFPYSLFMLNSNSSCYNIYPSRKRCQSLFFYYISLPLSNTFLVQPLRNHSHRI
jgi:hypothetical protein